MAAAPASFAFKAPFAVITPFTITGTPAARATSRSSLREVYDDIDKLEKTKLKVSHYNRRYEAYQPFAIAALLALLLEIFVRITWLKRL